MKKFRISLLWQVLIAIVAGIVLGQFLPAPVARLFVTFNGLFGNFLNFIIPLIIIGLIIPAIADLGKGAGRLLLITALIAYGSTVFSGFFTYFTGEAIFPRLIAQSAQTATVDNPGEMALKPFFTVEMPAPFDIMTALLLSLELFGGEGLPLYALCCGVSYMLSGYYGLYSEQKIVYSKFKTEWIDKKAQ